MFDERYNRQTHFIPGQVCPVRTRLRKDNLICPFTLACIRPDKFRYIECGPHRRISKPEWEAAP